MNIHTGEVEHRGGASSLNVIEVLGVVLLCIPSLAVLLAIAFLTAAVVLGLGIDVQGPPLLGKVFLVAFSYPLLSLFAGLALLIVFGRAAWRLARRLGSSTD
jgi:hypothetical protein